MPPAAWGAGAHTHHLKNLYVYFWRWATLQVFGSGWHEATGEPDRDRYGIVCFITVAGFLNGPGFQKMREDLRRDCDDIWVIDCSPEGHQPNVPTRIFQGVQQPVCIVLAARSANKSRDVPARLRYTALAAASAKPTNMPPWPARLEGSLWRTVPPAGASRSCRSRAACRRHFRLSLIFLWRQVRGEDPSYMGHLA